MQRLLVQMPGQPEVFVISLDVEISDVTFIHNVHHVSPAHTQLHRTIKGEAEEMGRRSLYVFYLEI